MSLDEVKRNFNQVDIKADDICFYRCLKIYFKKNKILTSN